MDSVIYDDLREMGGGKASSNCPNCVNVTPVIEELCKNRRVSMTNGPEDRGLRREALR
jgi:hypothetical protein